MAGRKRIIEAPVFKTWEEVDAALKEIAEEEIAIADIEGEMNKQINGINYVKIYSRHVIRLHRIWQSSSQMNLTVM